MWTSIIVRPVIIPGTVFIYQQYIVYGVHVYRLCACSGVNCIDLEGSTYTYRVSLISVI